VDLNAEAIQICQLSLWIKTAARGKQLTSVEENELVQTFPSDFMPSYRMEAEREHTHPV